ncbi:unnamed protein product (mitochondrion) [Plasmodiophora brassicae]|uniref:Uncharacterized protein n=1 Tax=Plasmodiophora brassicae TaxID=37360 RepID=A0A0G4IHF8_PLABS|nr:hypothetical protein PBRA_000384 [Plasmodiophora brassicae]SPQ96941.1 unnamed protein product [Plasmodiophora brassicae]
MECNVADLLDRARLLLSQCQPDVAVKFIERAIEQDSNDMAALDMLAEVLLELDRTEEAVRALRRSIDLYPNSNANKYMSLAQLLSGREALGLYERGIQLMLSGIDRDDSSVAAAYSAIAELFMTDLCDEDNAESNCEAAVEAAVNVRSDCPDPYRVMASLRIIQGRYEEAEAAVRSGLERIASSPFETRLDLAKSCIELGMFTDGLDLVDDLLAEDDRDCQLWVMAALCYLKEGNAEIAVEYCHAARAMALKQDDREMLNEIDAIQHELDNTPTT